MAKNQKELTEAWVESGLADAWGPNQMKLFDEATRLKEADELLVFGGKGTKITMGSGSGETEEFEGKAPKEVLKKPSAKVGKGFGKVSKGKLFTKGKDVGAAGQGEKANGYSCSKCRYSKTGCLKCNEAKYAKRQATKAAAEAKDAEDDAAKSPKKDVGEWEELKETEGELVAATKDDGDEKQDECDDGDDGDEGELDSESKSLLDSAFVQLKSKE